MIIVGSYQPVIVQADTPGPMTLEYDWESQVLTVTVIHAVTDPLTHYIYQIIVYKNGAVVETRNYSNQTSTDGVSDTFEVVAVAGDVLKATAKCNVSGQVTDEITVTNPGTTDTQTVTETETATTTQSSEGPSNQMFIAIFIITSVIVAIIAMCMYCGNKLGAT